MPNTCISDIISYKNCLYRTPGSFVINLHYKTSVCIGSVDDRHAWSHFHLEAIKRSDKEWCQFFGANERH